MVTGLSSPRNVCCSAMAAADRWWRDGVLYQIYPRSFADSDGDGIGDLRGIVARLEHLEWLGIDGIWLNPTMPSPNEDWGYDVSDYCGIHPDLGTLEDLDALVDVAGERGMRVLLDLVPNHTSDRHAWFVDALSGRDARYRDFYVWADPAPDGGPPNNWLSNFGGSAWQLHEPTGQYYLNNFLPSQPDLNWWNDEVRGAFDEVLRFWYARGIAGWRIDVCHAIVKDRELRDDPAVTEDDHPEVQKLGLRRVFSMNRPEVHEVLQRWRELSDAHDPPRALVGETYVLDLDQLIPYYGRGDDQLHLAFNFLFVHAELEAETLRTIVEHDAGASRLGEVALVDADGRIGKLDTVFYDTLIDENAASHIALGQGFPFLIPEDTRERTNESQIHIDFMIGSPEMTVTGLTTDGDRVPVLVQGNWLI
jgi:alpha-glucosidase